MKFFFSSETYILILNPLPTSLKAGSQTKKKHWKICFSQRTQKQKKAPHELSHTLTQFNWQHVSVVEEMSAKEQNCPVV